MKLKLNLSDVIFQMEILDPAGEPSRDWLRVNLSLEGPYVDYRVTEDELFMPREVAELARALEALLNHETDEDRTVELMEPDLCFRLYPAKRLYSVPGEVAYLAGTLDRKMYAEIMVSFWRREGGLGGNSFTMRLNEPEIRALWIYLEQYLGRIPAEDERVRELVRQGALEEESRS